MTRNCNLELNLFPLPDPDHHRSQLPPSTYATEQQEQQPLTIFYNGNVCVCDVTELQAKAILLLASRENEDKRRSQTPTGSCSSSEPPSPRRLPSPIYSPNNNNGLSMKRSLQRFLQKRNHRIQSTYPYNVNRLECSLHR